jgi:hypothetical protein
MKKIILIDYENIQKIDLSDINPEEYSIKIFIGQSQNKIPFDLVQNAQHFGDKIQWIKIDGTGSNALDFHIAYSLGRMSMENADQECIILSKDKGFDPLISFINKGTLSCRRINSILELSNSRKAELTNNKELERVLSNLKKIVKQKRPRKRNTLTKHVGTLFPKEISEEQLSEIIDALFVQEYITEENGKLTYRF